MNKLLAIGFALCATAAFATAGQGGNTLKAPQSDLKWWQNARFGMFIHWGPVSLVGTEIGWSRGGQRPGSAARAKFRSTFTTTSTSASTP